jgi:hypothetical protein
MRAICTLQKAFETTESIATPDKHPYSNRDHHK